MFVLNSLSPSNLSVVWQSAYSSESINRKMRGLPSGIVCGLRPVPSGIANLLRLNIDSVRGKSICNVNHNDYMITLLTSGSFLLNLHANSKKQYIAIRTNYTVASTTTGEIVAYNETEFESGMLETDQAILVCAVLYDGINPVDYDMIWNSGQTETTFKSFIRDEILFNNSSKGRSPLELLVDNNMDRDIDYSADSSNFSNVSVAIDRSDFLTGSGSTVFTFNLTAPNYILIRFGNFPTINDPSGLEPSRFAIEMMTKFDASFTGASEAGIDFSVLYEDGTIEDVSSSSNSHHNFITDFSSSWKLFRTEITVFKHSTYGQPLMIMPSLHFVDSSGIIGGNFKIDSVKIWQYNKEQSSKFIGDFDFPKKNPQENLLPVIPVTTLNIGNPRDSTYISRVSNYVKKLFIRSTGNTGAGIIFGNKLTTLLGSRNHYDVSFVGRADNFDINTYARVRSDVPLQSIMAPAGMWQGKPDGTNITCQLYMAYNLWLAPGIFSIIITGDPIDASIPNSSDYVVLASVEHNIGNYAVTVLTHTTNNVINIEVVDLAGTNTDAPDVSIVIFRKKGAPQIP